MARKNPTHVKSSKHFWRQSVSVDIINVTWLSNSVTFTFSGLSVQSGRHWVSPGWDRNNCWNVALV